jgi:hypothetical protein
MHWLEDKVPLRQQRSLAPSRSIAVITSEIVFGFATISSIRCAALLRLALMVVIVWIMLPERMFEGRPLTVTAQLEASQVELTVLHKRNGAFFDLTRLHFCVPADSIQPTGELATLGQRRAADQRGSGANC